MATVYDFAKIREKKLALVASYPPLECPHADCGKICQSTNVDLEGTVTYVCQGNGHRKLIWRIDVEGNMLKGATGKRYYQ